MFSFQNVFEGKYQSRFFELCNIWISKSNTTHGSTKTHKKITEKIEVTPFTLPSNPEFSMKLVSSESHYSDAKVSFTLKINETFYNANIVFKNFLKNVSKSNFEKKMKSFRKQCLFSCLFLEKDESFFKDVNESSF